MIQKPHQIPISIHSSKQTLKSASKKFHSNNPSSRPNAIPLSNKKKRTNSSLIENSNKKKLQDAECSQKKYNSNSSLIKNQHKIFEVQHILPAFGTKSTCKQSQPRVYSSITGHQQRSMPNKKFNKKIKDNESLSEIGYCKKVITLNPKAMSSCYGKKKAKALIDDSPTRKQDNIKTDLDQQHAVKQNNCQKSHLEGPKKSKRQKPGCIRKGNEQNQPNNLNQQQLIKLANIDVEELNKLDRMTSKQISQLQSRSQTIDLLKYTIKTKLQKDILSESPHKINSLISSYQKAPNQQYIDEILRLKELETNFYVSKITSLQNELNKYRKDAEKNQNEAAIRWQQENRKVLVEKTRLEEDNQLLRRENEALRAIIMKKVKQSSQKSKPVEFQPATSSINDY